MPLILFITKLNTQRQQRPFTASHSFLVVHPLLSKLSKLPLRIIMLHDMTNALVYEQTIGKELLQISCLLLADHTCLNTNERWFFHEIYQMPGLKTSPPWSHLPPIHEIGRTHFMEITLQIPDIQASYAQIALHLVPKKSPSPRPIWGMDESCSLLFW